MGAVHFFKSNLCKFCKIVGAVSNCSLVSEDSELELGNQENTLPIVITVMAERMIVALYMSAGAAIITETIHGVHESMTCFLTCYYRPKPGGFCKRLFRAIKALLAQGHVVHYLAVVPFPVEHPNCHFHRFPWFQNATSGYLFWGCFYLFAPLQLFYIGWRNRVDGLFAFGHSYALFLQPLRIIKKIPLSLFLRADTIRNHQIMNRPPVLIRLESLLEGLGIVGTRMYCVSKTLKQGIDTRHKIFLPEISAVLPNEITVQPGLAAKKVERPLRLACVGVLEPRKNQRMLLRVMRGFAADQVSLSLYGVGPDEQLLKKRAKEGKLLNRVHFMGWIASENIWPDVDLLLMPSLHEGAPNAMLEALGNGVMVLASAIPEHAEILPDRYLLAVDDSGAWLKRIQSILLYSDTEIHASIEEQSRAGQGLLFDWDLEIVSCICCDC